MLHTKNKPVAPQPGRVVGTRYPKPLGLSTATRAVSAPVAPPANALHYVVSKGYALPLQGYSATVSKSGNATLYAVFNTHAQASAYIKANKMRLFAVIVSV